MVFFLQKMFVSSKEERKQERIRKLFHLLGVIIPFCILAIDKKLFLILNLLILIPFVIADYYNLFIYLDKIPFLRGLLKLFRVYELEKGTLNGLSWLFIGLLIVVSLFDKYLASLSFAVLIFCDASAAIIGKNFGRIKICGSKTLEGTTFFIFIGFIVYTIFVNFVFPENLYFDFLYIAIALLMSSLIELISKKINIDDNFAVPFMFCITYNIMYVLMG